MEREQEKKGTCEMGDAADYIKYVTEKIVTWWERAPESPEMRQERRKRREPWVTRWFGQLLPVGVEIWRRQRRQKAESGRQTAYSQGAWTSSSEER